MSQGSTVLPTTGVFSGLTEQGNINAALAALLSNNSGGSAPSSPIEGQWFANTSVGGTILLQMYTGSAWVTIFTLDLSTNELAFASSGPQNWVAASGTHDAITATYDPPVTTLVDGMVLSFRATSANLTATPTLNPNGLGASTITKNGGQALAIGDIRGNLAEVQLRYNFANTRWELLNPPDVLIGGIVPYFGGAPVPSGFALCQGQNLSATTYPAANLVLGTTYGNPGGGNFTMPDLRGRFFFNLDAGGSGRITSAGGNFDGTVLGNTGGAQSRNLSSNQIPQFSFTPSGAVSSSVSGGIWGGQTEITGATIAGGGSQSWPTNASNISVSSSFAGNSISIGNASPNQVPMIPPAMGVNCMMRIA